MAHNVLHSLPVLPDEVNMCPSNQPTSHSNIVYINQNDDTQTACACSIQRLQFGILILTFEDFKCEGQADCPWKLDVYLDGCFNISYSGEDGNGKAVVLKDTDLQQKVFLRLISNVPSSKVTFRTRVIQSGEKHLLVHPVCLMHLSWFSYGSC